ncbi:MAG: winged helix-turn-helix transcriptional regulator [Clostridia bacterium]|nr:winged helix-turn-helix transcriptional regulator [Clostridia bacterium]
MEKFIMPNQTEIEKVGNLFKIIGDSTRLKLIFLLLEKPKTVSELCQTSGCSQSLVSHQLKILKDNYIVSSSKQGNFVTYFLIDEHISILLNICRTHINEKEN